MWIEFTAANGDYEFTVRVDAIHAVRANEDGSAAVFFVDAPASPIDVKQTYKNILAALRGMSIEASHVWIEHTAGAKCPCDRNYLVYIKGNGYEWTEPNYVHSVIDWSLVTHYRYAE